MTCKNCGNQITCGCQVRVASNGKSCCTSCLSTYESTLVKKPTDPSNVTATITGS